MLVSASGTAGVLGLIVKWRQDRMTAAAATTATVIDGLTAIAQERAADLVREREVSARKDERIAQLEAELLAATRRPKK